MWQRETLKIIEITALFTSVSPTLSVSPGSLCFVSIIYGRYTGTEGTGHFESYSVFGPWSMVL